MEKSTLIFTPTFSGLELILKPPFGSFGPLLICLSASEFQWPDKLIMSFWPFKMSFFFYLVTLWMKRMCGLSFGGSKYILQTNFINISFKMCIVKDLLFEFGKQNVFLRSNSLVGCCLLIGSTRGICWEEEKYCRKVITVMCKRGYRRDLWAPILSVPLLSADGFL